MSATTTVERGRCVIRLEAEALAAAADRLGPEFDGAVDVLARTSGRVLIAGLGKSGIVGSKIAATLTSTGTPASFLHPSESLHGDLGIVGAGDTAVLISKSGETEELVLLLEHLRRFGVCIIAILGAIGSTLGRHADVVLDASVAREACPHGLAPTTSTTTALAIGDALAVALLERKGFRAEDFARLHPGGALGRRLLTRVKDIMVVDMLPLLSPEATMRQAVVALAERRGIVVAVDDDRRAVGVMTAGDLTRLMERVPDVWDVTVAEIMTRAPRVTAPGELASAAVYQMERHGIMAMPVVDDGGAVVGVVHLHDLLRAGLA